MANIKVIENELCGAVYYFAYGSNMSALRLSERLVKRGEVLIERQHATLYGYRLTFDKVSSTKAWEGFANIVPDLGGRVEGTINMLSEGGLQVLDRVELVPHHYHRRYVTVHETRTEKKILAATYIANPEMIRSELRPTKEYLIHLLQAADVLSSDYAALLRKIECEE